MQILAASEKPDGKVLNALNFPMPLKGIQRTSYTSDAHALHETINQRGWKQAVPPPIQDVVWSGALTKYAFHGWRIDNNGFGISAGPDFGEKWWLSARPKKDQFRPFSSINMYLNDKYHPHHGNSDMWDVEGVLLDQGTRM